MATTTLTYTITVSNQDDKETPLNKIDDDLPPGFSYVTGSGLFTPPTGSATNEEPSISGQRLAWNITTPQLQPAESATLTFNVVANVGAGTYCNEAWATPGVSQQTSTGKTAIVVVGSPSPPDDLCPGPAVNLTKTVFPKISLSGFQTTHTYTITIQNIGTAVLNVRQIEGLLPKGFVYEMLSTSGDITTNDPNRDPTAPVIDDRQRLDWAFTPHYQIQPGETKTLSFDVRKDANVAAAYYWNEVWLDTAEFPHDAYTWPTTPVQVLSIMLTCTTDGQTSVSSQVWVGAGTSTIGEWELTQTDCPPPP